MGWNDRDDRMLELYDEASGLEEYYSELTGKAINIFVEGYEDIRIETSRTSGNEHFASMREVDNRLKQLYSDILIDDGDTTDPYAGL